MKAIWNEQIIAESSETVVLETNHYFPIESINEQYFKKNENTSVCGWKGTAEYYDIVVDGQTNVDAAWYYRSPKDAAKNIEGRVAFWRGVKITE